MNEEERISQVKMNHTHESVGMFIIKALEQEKSKGVSQQFLTENAS